MSIFKVTNTPQETIELGKNIAKQLKPGDVIALIGSLGSGKTTLTKGIAEGLGVKNPGYVNSPTFVLVREYKGRINLFHIDLYRLSNLMDIEDIGLREYFYSGGVSVVEWAERAEGLLPKEHLKIEIDIAGDNAREIKIDESISGRYINKDN